MVFISNYNVVFKGSNTFEDNNGTALRVCTDLSAYVLVVCFVGFGTSVYFRH